MMSSNQVTMSEWFLLLSLLGVVMIVALAFMRERSQTRSVTPLHHHLMGRAKFAPTLPHAASRTGTRAGVWSAAVGHPIELSARPGRDVRMMAAVSGTKHAGFAPVEERILVRPIAEAVPEMGGGLVMPDTFKDKPQKGLVLATGPGLVSEISGERIPMDIQQGDTVMYGKMAGTDVTVDGETLLLLIPRDVLGVLDA